MSSVTELNVGLGGWDRQKDAGLYYGYCDICKKAGAAIAVDTSDGEYGSCVICEKCINELFSNNREYLEKEKQRFELDEEYFRKKNLKSNI